MPDDLRSRDFRKILLIKLSAVGDVVHTLPVLNKLRRRYPAARSDWLVTPAIAELLQHNPAISNVIEFARDEWSAPWRLTPYVAAARLIAQAARRRIRSGARPAGPIAQRRFCLHLRRPGADRFRQAARRYLEDAGAQNPRRSAQARLAGRARRQLARLYRSHRVADARYPSGRALSRHRPDARPRRRRRRISHFRSRRKRAPASTRWWTITRSPRQNSW